MPRKPREPREIPADFIAALEAGVRDVLKDPAATATQRLQAVAAGVKLEFLRHKIKDDGGEGGSYFPTVGT